MIVGKRRERKYLESLGQYELDKASAQLVRVNNYGMRQDLLNPNYHYYVQHIYCTHHQSTQKMKATIQQAISKLEKERNITILYACESGSRAWGFGSPDSDYDVRFIYTKPVDWYLSIEQHKDVIDLPIDANELDFSGWDIKKLLSLFRKANASPFEWLQSPIVYQQKNDFRARMWALANDYFIPKAMISHYLGIGKSTYHTAIKDDRIKIKKYFYILRPLFAAKWIVEYGTIPPMEFHLLRKVLEKHPKINQFVESLLAAKLKANESDEIQLIPELQGFIEEQFEYCMAAAKQLPNVFASAEPLNQFFRQIIQENDHTRATR